jgi:hypothetical protein
MSIRAGTILAISLLLVTTRPSGAQEMSFPYTTFVTRDSLAHVLLRYDACAWRASDALLEHDSSSLPLLGPEWFCLNQGGRWHAIFGRFDPSTDRYRIVVHYVVADSTPVHSSEQLDTLVVTADARAIHRAAGLLPPSFDGSRFRFNTYVLPQDSTIVVWILPAMQPSGELVFGAEAQYSFDRSGHELKQQQVVEGPIRWFRADTSVAFRIDSNSPDVPTVGDLFFYYSVRGAFKSIRIKTAKYSSSRIATDSGQVWVHVLLDH